MVSHGTTRFEEALSALKEQGSALLVVGTVPDESFERVTTQLLGNGSDLPRRRLVVTTEEKLEGLRRRLPDSPWLPLAQSTKVITLAEQDRSVAAQATPEQTEIPVESVSKDDLSALSQRILENIEEFKRQGGPFDPAELRVSIDSLTPLLRANGQEKVFRMVHPLNNVIKGHNGMVHYHLPVERESATARTFEAVFDAVIELRVTEGTLQQRWHLREEEISSDWLPVEEQ